MSPQQPLENVSVRRLTEADTHALHDLRLRVLRPGQPPAFAVFPGDDEPTTVHLGAFLDGGGAGGGGERCVGIVTLVRRDGLQLRGMAVDPTVQRRGVGEAVLDAAHRAARDDGFAEMWCNARVAAVGFYERNGWVKEGVVFDITGVGPHYVMRRRL